MRQLIINKNPDKKGLVLIEGKDFHYLRQVLRLKAGDMVKVRLPDGTLQNSTVCKIDDSSKKITLQICALREPQGPQGGQGPQDVIASEARQSTNEIQFTLFQFIPKPQKLELIVRQATECGVKNIVPVISEYTQKGNIEALKGSKLERLQKIVREARQQSGSPVATKVFEPLGLEQAIDFWNEFKNESDEGKACKAIGFVLSERSVENLTMRELLQKEKPGKICIVCGNEGGISPDELELLVKKGLFHPIHFSVNILRCETAALYGIAAVQTGV